MDITPALPRSRHIIESYGGGRFMVQQQRYTQHLFIWPEGAIGWGDQPLESLSCPMPEQWPSLMPEMLILGTGLRMSRASLEFQNQIKNQNIKLEVMDSGAACRTYNVLCAEDRRVAAIIMLV